MTDNRDHIQGIERSQFNRIILILIISILVMGSINQGIFSGNFQISDFVAYFIIILFFYVLIVFFMFLIGGDPSKFEIMFVPTIIISVTIFGLWLLQLIPTVDPPPPQNNGETTTTEISSIISSDQTDVPGTSISTQSTTLNEEVQNLIDVSQLALFVILIFFVIGAAIYIYKNRSVFEPKLTIAQEIEYSQPKFQSNKDIIECYIDASENIERVKGEAPEWFSPSFFAEHVDYSPGPPLSSYFNRLTKLYEWARFSNQEMTENDVIEAKELLFEIKNQLQHILEKLKEEQKH